jgi:gamma-glutamylcyclotransferase (GGCT)/AIG2-like uncharacterized protein YtfP
MPLLLVYGSLRKTSKRGFNFNRFGGQTYIRTLELDGYRMHSYGAYPAVTPDPGGSIVAEVHEVEPEAFNCIKRMELGAGYTYNKVTLDDGEVATIYVAEDLNPDKYPHVVDGDWK